MAVYTIKGNIYSNIALSVNYLSLIGLCIVLT